MKNLKNFILFFVLLAVALILIPNLSNAESASVGSEEDLLEAIENADNGDVITLTNSISLSAPIGLNNINITINGAGNTITKDDDWQPVGPNGTLITAGEGATLNLVNINLTNSQKYGVQAYNGGYVILDNVNISNCGFGGVLINAGTVEVKKVYLGHNGREDSNNGIEIAKSATLSDDPSEPILKMNGTISSDQTKNVIYVDVNDPVANFQVVNEPDSPNKIFLNDNKLVVTNQNNEIIFESDEIEDLELTIENYARNITLTVNLMEQSINITIQEGSTLSEDEVRSYIDLNSLGLGNYTLDGFYVDKDFTTAYDFTQVFEDDTTIYAKLTLVEQPSEPLPQEQDSTPKTGYANTLEIALSVIAISAIGLVVLNRKEF